MQIPSLPSLSIRHKLVLLTGAASLLALLLAAMAFVVNDVYLLRQADVEHLSAQAEVWAAQCRAPLLKGDLGAAENVVHSLRYHPNILQATLTDADGATLSAVNWLDDQTTSESAVGGLWSGGGEYEMQTDIESGGRTLGVLTIRAHFDWLTAQLGRFVKIATIVLLCALSASILLSSALQRHISRPLEQLAETAGSITRKGDYSLRAPVESADEVGTVCLAVNRMLDRVEEGDRRLQFARDDLEVRVHSRTAQLESEISRRAQIQRDLEFAKMAAEDAKFTAEEASQAKSEFLANMSHEIRTPLNGILGYADLLRVGADNDDPKERQEYIETIRTCGKHLLGLINDILDLSKIEAGKFQVEQVACSPRQIIAEVLSLLRVKASEKEISLDCNWTTDIPETIQSDPQRLRQLLVNLVGNAIKFTERGGVAVIASLHCDKPEPTLEVRIVDTGIGIAADKIDSIFLPFVQADNSVTRRFGGTGLGLAISRRIARALGGDLTCRSREGSGSEFILVIPTGSLAGVALAPAHGSDAVVDRKSQPRPRTSLANCRVLLVEDGETNRKLISLVLRRAGAEVTTAENGREGVDKALSAPFDLILMDMQMPVLDGYSAARELRAAGLATPVIALTAHALAGDAQKCREAGCSGFLTKPIAPEQLVQSVAEVWQPETAPQAATEAASAQSQPAQPIHSSLPMDDADFREISAEFVETLQSKLKLLHQAADENDLEAVRRLAHWLRGAGGMAGFGVFTAPAGQLETAATNARTDLLCPLVHSIQTLAERIELPEPVEA